MKPYEESPPIRSAPEQAAMVTVERRRPTEPEMDEIFQLCRSNNWHMVLTKLCQNPEVALETISMENHIVTTIMHQAITSKGETAIRARVISTILFNTPQASAIRNGYGSLPLHVIAQRNTKMDAQTKERLIYELVKCNPGALVQEGGVGKRTPLHIIFTDYISPRLTKVMIEAGSKACFMKDKKGYLPAHVACSRHCSPEKLRMLLEVNPSALWETTIEGKTLLSLATEKSTKSHPNYALIDEINRQLASQEAASRAMHMNMRHCASLEDDSTNRSRLDSNDSHKSWQSLPPLHDYERSGSSRKRKANDPAADLLLHFSRNNSSPRCDVFETGHYAQV